MAVNKEFIMNVEVNYKKAVTEIVDLKKNIEALKNENQQLAKAEGDNREAMEANNALIKEYKRQLQDVQKSVKQQIKAEEEQKGSLQQLRAELSKLNQEYAKLSREERNGGKGQKIAADINRITTELRQAEFGLQQYYRNVGNYRNSILEAIGMNTQFGSSLANIATNTNGISGMMESASNSVKAFGAACSSLLANPVVLSLLGIAGVGMLFNFWKEYNDQMSEAIRLTKEFTGETGRALEEIVASVKATADAFGKDYLEVLRTMDSLMAQFHITSQEAMEAINNGFAAGADLSGNMLANIQQYAPIFKDAGLSAEQMIAIIAQTRSGIFSQGGLDAIAMASKRIREMSSATKSSLEAIGLDADKILQELANGTKNTFDIIQEVSAAMRNFGADSAEVGNAIKDVFGKQGVANGIEMLETLDKMTTSMEDVLEVTGEYGQLQKEELDLDKQIEEATMEVFAIQDGGWDSVKLKVTNFIKDGLLEVIRAVRDTWRGFKYLFVMMSEGLTAASKSWSEFKNGMRAVFRDLGTIVSTLGDAFKSLFNFDFDAAKANWQRGMNMLGNIMTDKFNGIEKAYKEMHEKIAEGKNEILGIGDYTDEEPTTGGNHNGSNNGNNNNKKGKIASKLSGKVSKAALNAKKDAKDAAEIAKKARLEEQKSADENLRYQRKLEDEKNALLADSAKKRRIILDAQLRREEEDLKTALARKKITQAQYDEQIIVLTQKGAIKRKELTEKEIQIERQESIKLIQARIDNVEKGSKEELVLRALLAEKNEEQAIAAAEKEFQDAERREQMVTAIRLKYAKDRMNLLFETEEASNKMLAQARGEVWDDSDDAIESRRTAFYQKLLDDAKISGEQRLAIEAALNASSESQEADSLKKKQDLQQQYYDTLNASLIATGQAIGNALGKMFKGEEDAMKEFLKNMINIVLDSIEKMVIAWQAASVARNVGELGFTGMVKAGLEAAAITAAFEAAKAAVSAGFATGGLVEGTGTGTSDSIVARVSNGESVMTANATSMFAPLLSTINQMGGGVPIGISQTGNQAMGEEMLANAVAKGVAQVKPVVSVEEINRVQNRVDVLESLGGI